MLWISEERLACPFTRDHGSTRLSHPTCIEWDGGWVGGVPRGSFPFALWLLMLMRLAWEDDDEREEDIPYPRLFFFSLFGFLGAWIQASEHTDISRRPSLRAAE